MNPKELYHYSLQGNSTERPSAHISVHGLMLEEFREFINAAANCAPNASPAMKELIDLVTNGRILQDYYAQANLPRPT